MWILGRYGGGGVVKIIEKILSTLADLGKRPPVHAPYSPKFSQFHVVFLEKFGKFYVGTP